MTNNVPQSIAPLDTDTHERQRTLPVGPTGVVHRGGVPWHKRLALTKAPSPTAHHVLLVLGSFVSDGQSDAWPSVSTLTSMTGLSRRAVQTALRALEGANLVITDTVPGRSSRYRLAPTYASPAPPPAHLLRPPCAPAAPEGTREVIKRREAAPLPLVPVQEGVDEKPKAETSRPIGPLTSKPAEDRQICPPSTQPAESNRPIGPLSQPARHTCSCGHNWPVSFGPTCFKCQRKVGFAGGAAPMPGKYACLEDDPEPSGAAPVPGKYNSLFDPEPDPPRPLTPELRAELEADAISNGYRLRNGQWRDGHWRDGQWVKSYAS